ncbi:class II aldolase/adducin family protein [Candidatus Laterigemmans baculatus]|uniref:class II aldolase/adducin family protein n=1 Tax=Candidatus Laterigemmans baculatus TaxID=2770505 RepID=UPI0013DB41C5|nr:class II aldolase/adducin family protein [Candidatus Laterigemmans baculatus]
MQNIHKIKQDICDIGRRIYDRQFAAANDGNITVRVGENEVLCTPTMHCKGFLKPDDIALVDMTGKQISGRKKRSSEALLHLEIYRQRPDIRSVVHCHPPHATAFAIAREAIPQCVLPEVEVFLGDVPITKYETPGGQAFADTIIPFVDKSNVIILANHGTVSYGENVERAYWWTEILDSYCRMLMLARQLGHVQYLDEGKTRELLELKDKWGFADPRNTDEYKNCDVCANDIFRDSWQASGVQRRAFPRPASSGGSPAAGSQPAGNQPAGSQPAGNQPAGNQPAGNAAAAGDGQIDEEQLVKLITGEVMRQLGVS